MHRPCNNFMMQCRVVDYAHDRDAAVNRFADQGDDGLPVFSILGTFP